ncbi:MAG: MBL fold metallo-hydrolase [Candidatus Heimdallarchaeota archaeon]
MYDFIQPLSDEFKDIYFIKGERNGNYPYSHSILIEDFLIDTGISAGIITKLKKFFPIKSVILSHWHEDHISGNHLLVNSKFLCHTQDKAPIEDLDLIYPYYRVDNTAAGDQFRSMVKSLGMQNTEIYKTFEDNEIISIREHLQLKVIHTPGHTAGHCGFIETNSNIAFFGDIDLTRFPYYATTDANLTMLENSIQKLKNLDINIAILGHRDPIYGSSKIREELDNFQSVINKRDERILSHLSEQKPIRPIDLRGKNLIYRRYTFEIFEVMIEKHFEKFQCLNLISKKQDGFVLN